MKKKSFSGNHQRSWLWGRHPVVETLQSGRWPVLEIFATPDAFDQLSGLLEAKRSGGIPVRVVSSDRLEQLCRSTEHQGLLARMGDYPYRSVVQFEQELQEKSAASTADSAGQPDSPRGLKPLIVICDRIQDTFNFGAILRCCDGANALAVVVGERAQALVTPHVARSSAGAVNHITIVRSPDLVATARNIRSLGWQLVAADCHAQHSVWDTPLKGLTALIIGSEAHGISPELLAICDQRVTIPMHGQVSSLNAAVAAGILLYEIRRQQLSSSPN